MQVKSFSYSRFSMSHSWLAAIAVASLGAAGCGPADKGGASPDEAQQRIQATVPGMTESLSRSMERWGENQNLSSLSQSLDTVSASFERMFPSLVTEDEAVEPLVRLLAEGDETGEEADVGAAIEALAEKIFTEENHEGNGVYLVRGALFCEVDGAVDPDCAAQIDQMELRVHAVEAGDGLDLGFRIGPDQAEPFGIELRSDRLSLVLDLADLKSAIEFLSEDDEATAGLPQVMDGVLAFSLLAPSANEAEVQVAVREALAFETDSSGTGSAMKFSTEARDPLFSVRMSETQMVMAVDVGRTRVTGPWGEIQGDGLELGNLDIDWQGLTYQIDLSADSDVLAVRNIGLGDGTSTIKLDSETLLSVDLNKDSGRTFDLELSLDEAGLPLLAVAPGIDLQVSYDLQALSEGGVAIDAPVLTSSYALSLGGDAPVVQPVDADALAGFPGGLRVVSGELVVSAEGAAESVVVPAGKCLVELEPAADAHPLLGALSAVDCPQ
jgi:hypothetical protein